jgi:hypothetical protein
MAHTQAYHTHVGDHTHSHADDRTHTHTHTHADDRTDTHAAATEAAASAQIRDYQASSASVALDVGAGRGALVIYPDEGYRDCEIEISAVDGDGRRVHTGVHDRATHTGQVLTAIFGSLAAGDYRVWRGADAEGPVVTVPDGVVTELSLG